MAKAKRKYKPAISTVSAPKRRIDNPVKKAWISRASELYKMKLISGDELKTLLVMINSPDQENLTVAQELIRSHIRRKFAEGLNGGQAQAYDQIIDFFYEEEHDAVIVKGYAGTGKTFMVKRVMDYIMYAYPNHKIAVTAPTNKAVQVLYKSSAAKTSGARAFVFEDEFDGKSRLTYSTIHKLMRYKEQILPDGKQVFIPDGSGNNRLSDYQYLIVDEVSMLDDHLCQALMTYSKKVKIIFMGDPAQIPPVNREDSIPFRGDHSYKFKQVVLTEIMRQKGDNAIVDRSFSLRENLEKDKPIPISTTKLNSNGHGVIHLDSATERDKVRPLLNRLFLCKEFKEDANHAKVIAWRNKTVEYINSVIREILFRQNPPRFSVGEKLLANKPVFTKKTYLKGNSEVEVYRMAFSTSEEFTVERVDEVWIDFDTEESRFRSGPSLKVYELLVKGYDEINQQVKRHVITVIHEDSLAEYQELLQKARALAKERQDVSLWKRYYDMKKWSANLSYNYAITAHKSQGSTYKNVLLIEEDLDYNFKTVERNRIKYTAYSRASERLYVLRLNTNTKN